jgi:hypothetical protein
LGAVYVSFLICGFICFYQTKCFYLALAIVDFILRELVAQNCLLFWCSLFSDDAVVRLCLDLYRVVGFGAALV